MKRRGSSCGWVRITWSYWSPNAWVCTAAAATSVRYDQLTLIPPSDGYHCGICTQRFSIAFGWVFRVSKCYRLIFTPHAAEWHKQQPFELQIGIKKKCMIQTMTFMPVEIKEMSSNVSLPPPCYENVRKLAKIAPFPVSKKVHFLRMEDWVCVTVKELSQRVEIRLMVGAVTQRVYWELLCLWHPGFEFSPGYVQVLFIFQCNI